LASTESIPTITAPCELGRHDRCRGVILSLTESNGRPCQCPVGCHDPAPEPDQEETYLDRRADDALDARWSA
jgi:hypothetical protein